jgi:ribonuclease HI
MELIAAIEGLRALNRSSQVTVLTDSEYVRRGITEFLPRWKANGWRW